MSNREVWITWLGGPDIEQVALSNEEILDAVESALAAQGRGEAVVDPRAHLRPSEHVHGHFNLLRGYVEPLQLAGVKVVSDYVDNWRQSLPSEMALLNLFRPDNGAPVAVMSASAITYMRTGAMTALGAKQLARKDSRVLGHIGTRGTAYWNVRLLDHLFDFDEIRVHSRRPESRERFGKRLESDLGKRIVVTEDWQSCLEGADVMVEASRLTSPTPLFRTEWVKPGCTVIPYGTVSALAEDFTDVFDKIVVDDWGQATVGPFGSLRRQVDSGRITRESIHGELGHICAGRLPGRERDEEAILFWHRGLSSADIALGAVVLDRAEALGLGQRLRFA